MGEQTNFADSGRIPPQGKLGPITRLNLNNSKKLVKARILKATAVVQI